MNDIFLQFNGHFSTVSGERILIEDDVSVVCIKVTSASYMKKYLTIAYRVVLDKGGLGKAIGLQAQCCPKRFSIKTKKGSKAKVERTTLAKSTTSFTSYGKYNTFRTSNR